MYTWIKVLETGREIEFEYANKVYFIGSYDEGRCIFDNKNESITTYYNDVDLFLSNSKINDIFFKQLIEDGYIKIITIF
ncbi:hypothetical protein [Romboutsia lituseburensis]|uniref:hypothetical protein n=1 Tax=Romboutsia lituseburensis TaxID=1537 RepID=UPI00215AD727|nr:hypothetical protein [Romboutsia lituseburensis]MCR8747168.1 hypothetical protein [Romboutsia lituseburensis]